MSAAPGPPAPDPRSQRHRAMAFALCCADEICQGGWDDSGEKFICDHHNSVALRLLESSEFRDALAAGAAVPTPPAGLTVERSAAVDRFRRALDKLLYAQEEWARRRPDEPQAERERLADECAIVEKQVYVLYEQALDSVSPGAPPAAPTA